MARKKGDERVYADGSTEVRQMQADMLLNYTAMEAVRQPYMDHWRDITRYLLPYGGRYLATDRDRQVSQYQDIIDETGLQASEILRAGMLALRTSPARPWFRYQTRDRAVNKSHPVRRWLYLLQQVTQDIFRASNTYEMYPHCYGETSSFGTACSVMAEDDEDVIRHFPMTAGEFCLATDGRRRVNVMYRQFSMSAAELIQEFGAENCSKQVVNAYERKQRHAQFLVMHVIEPRSVREYGALDSKNMPWKSCYFEVASQEGKWLREGGYRTFPVLAPRWDVIGNNTYGEGIGTKVLGSVRQLQKMQEDFCFASENQARPAVQVPTQVANRDRDLLPGGQIPYDQTTPQGGVRNAFEVPLRLDYTTAAIQDVRQRINKSYYVNLFQSLSSLDDQTQRTRIEIIGRREEGFTMLSPVTQRMQRELDTHLIEFTLGRILELGLMPPAPPELQGMELQVEQIGPLAQALKAIDAQNVDRFTTALGHIAILPPGETLDKFDRDEWVDFYSDTFNVPPDLVVPGDKVALIRDARNRALAAKDQLATLEQQSKITKNLAGAPTGGDPNAFTDATRAVAGYT